MSERHDFARACIKHGIKFVGPHPDVMYKMGDKIQARKTAIANNVPVIPGTEKPVKNFAEVSIEYQENLQTDKNTVGNIAETLALCLHLLSTEIVCLSRFLSYIFVILHYFGL